MGIGILPEGAGGGARGEAGRIAYASQASAHFPARLGLVAESATDEAAGGGRAGGVGRSTEC